VRRVVALAERMIGAGIEKKFGNVEFGGIVTGSCASPPFPHLW
jgi:hypothetical protein